MDQVHPAGAHSSVSVHGPAMDSLPELLDQRGDLRLLRRLDFLGEHSHQHGAEVEGSEQRGASAAAACSQGNP